MNIRANNIWANLLLPWPFLVHSYAEFNVHGSVHRKNIPLYVQQDATLHSLFYLETVLHVSGCTTTHHQERKQLYLQHGVFLVCSSPLCWRYNCQYTYVKNRRNTAVIMSANKLRLLYCCYKATTCFDPVNRAIFRSSTM